MNPRIALSLTALFLVVGCASKIEKHACLDKDWYELGRRDGIQGAVLTRKEVYRNECGSSFSADLQTIYMNGRNAGLVEYCDKSNAFDLGRMGIIYNHVCPSMTEDDFLKEYRRGQQARQLEMEKRRLDTQMIESDQDLLNKMRAQSEDKEPRSQFSN